MDKTLHERVYELEEIIRGVDLEHLISEVEEMKLRIQYKGRVKPEWVRKRLDESD